MCSLGCATAMLYIVKCGGGERDMDSYCLASNWFIRDFIILSGSSLLTFSTSFSMA